MSKKPEIEEAVGPESAAATKREGEQTLKDAVEKVHNGAKELTEMGALNPQQSQYLQQSVSKLAAVSEEKGLSEVGKLAKAKKALGELGSWVEKQVSHAKEAVKKAFQGFGETVTKAAESVSQGLSQLKGKAQQAVGDYKEKRDMAAGLRELKKDDKKFGELERHQETKNELTGVIDHLIKEAEKPQDLDWSAVQAFEKVQQEYLHKLNEIKKFVDDPKHDLSKPKVLKQLLQKCEKLEKWANDPKTVDKAVEGRWEKFKEKLPFGMNKFRARAKKPIKKMAKKIVAEAFAKHKGITSGLTGNVRGLKSARETARGGMIR